MFGSLAIPQALHLLNLMTTEMLKMPSKSSMDVVFVVCVFKLSCQIIKAEAHANHLLQTGVGAVTVLMTNIVIGMDLHGVVMMTIDMEENNVEEEESEHQNIMTGVQEGFPEADRAALLDTNFSRFLRMQRVQSVYFEYEWHMMWCFCDPISPTKLPLLIV